MSRVRSKDTSVEIRVRRAAHSIGLRYRLHRNDLPGKPDLVFPRFGLALFVHGCFWHRHPGCRKASTPKSREDFWAEKFDKNVRRDSDAVTALSGLGWRSAIIWECETRDPDELRRKLKEFFYDVSQ
nr:DNA mismatch endonuclease Vsr [Mesorhizobium sophorae]